MTRLRPMLAMYEERGARKRRALEARAANPRAKVVHLDRMPPERSGYVPNTNGRPRCGASGQFRITADEDAVTCIPCAESIPGDREEFELGLDRYTYVVIENAANSSFPFGARWRAMQQLALRHPDEFAELEETERVMGALAGRRR